MEVLLPSKFLLGYNANIPVTTVAAVLLPSKFLLGYNECGSVIYIHDGSATIEIFARLQRTISNYCFIKSSATIEIFARLQQI